MDILEGLKTIIQQKVKLINKLSKKNDTEIKFYEGLNIINYNDIPTGHGVPKDNLKLIIDGKQYEIYFVINFTNKLTILTPKDSNTVKLLFDKYEMTGLPVNNVICPITLIEGSPGYLCCTYNEIFIRIQTNSRY